MNPIVRMMKRYIKMPLKHALPLLFISALVLSATTGCINNNNPTATPTATHDVFLEKYLAEYEKEMNSNASRQVNLWNVEWINSTSASLSLSYQEKTRLVKSDQTITVFPTTQNATNYLNAMNKTKYSLSNATYQTTGGAYRMATGHAPQIYKDYLWNEGSGSWRHIIQLDTIINTIAAKTSTAPSIKPTPTPTPTAIPTASGGTLSQAQLTFINSYFQSEGYVVVEPFAYSYKDATSGNSVYEGKLTKGGDTFNCNIESCKNKNEARSELTDSVNALEALGFVGSYDSADSWSGTFIDGGTVVEGSTFIPSTWDPPAVITIFAD